MKEKQKSFYHNFRVPDANFVLGLPDCLVPKTVQRFYYLMQFSHLFHATEDEAFEHCVGNNGKIYEGAILGVSRNFRQKGLGNKLVKHSLVHAKEIGCSHAHVLASSIYSQAIMKKNGFKVIFEKNFSEWEDKHGNVIIQHQIHKSAQMNVLKLDFLDF